MTRRFAIIAALSITALSGAALAQADALTRNPVEVQAGSYVLDPAHGKITWSVDHMGFLTYVGQFTDVAAHLDLDVRNPAASKLDASDRYSDMNTKGIAASVQIFKNPDKDDTSTEGICNSSLSILKRCVDIGRATRTYWEHKQ